MVTDVGEPSSYVIVVSIVTYHSNLDDVHETLKSLQDSQLSSYVMVVDNASSHEYQQALQQLCDEMHVTLIKAARNGGYGYGHNLALLQAPPSDYYLVLNPDVVVHEAALSELSDFLTHHPEAGLVAPKVLYPDGRLQPLNKRVPNVLDLALRLAAPPFITRIPAIARRMERYMMVDEGYDHAYPLPFSSGCCMLFRRTILMRLGGFDERFFLYFEDADITQRVNLIAESWYCPDAMITHHWQRASRKKLTLLWIMLKSAAQYFTKWGLKLW